jgi:hypothetical protein
MSDVKVWLLVPKKKNLYAPSFKGTLAQALEKAAKRAAEEKTSYEIWEPDPVLYRAGDHKRLVATVSAPPK